MTTEDYIASGILDVYACGGLTIVEQEEVEKVVQKYPKIKAELNRIESALENYAQLQAITPPPHLKKKILNQFNAVASTTERSENETIKPIYNSAIAKQQPGNSNTNFWLIAAAVTLLLISAGLNLYFYSNWQKAEQILAINTTENAAIAQNFRQAGFKLKQSEVALNILKNTETNHVKLAGLPKAPQYSAVIHWEPKTKIVLLEVKNLPAAPAGKQYQLWALQNGKPVDAGLINSSEIHLGIQQMKEINKAEAFAMTLEPIGGSINPTMDQMFLLGKL